MLGHRGGEDLGIVVDDARAGVVRQVVTHSVKCFTLLAAAEVVERVVGRVVGQPVGEDDGSPLVVAELGIADLDGPATVEGVDQHLKGVARRLLARPGEVQVVDRDDEVIVGPLAILTLEMPVEGMPVNDDLVDLWSGTLSLIVHIESAQRESGSGHVVPRCGRQLHVPGNRPLRLIQVLVEVVAAVDSKDVIALLVLTDAAAGAARLCLGRSLYGVRRRGRRKGQREGRRCDRSGKHNSCRAPGAGSGAP